MISISTEFLYLDVQSKTYTLKAWLISVLYCLSKRECCKSHLLNKFWLVKLKLLIFYVYFT